ALLDFLNDKLGAGRFAADVFVMSVTNTDWLGHLDALLGLMSARGAELMLRPAHIEIAGLAPDKARESAERLKTAFGAPWQVEVFDVAERVDRTTQVFRREMAAVIDSGHPCAPTDVARVLNTQIVDFARSSGHVPASAKENLDEAALLLKTCSNVGHPVKIEIASFTDSMGNAQALVQLSQKRADAIRALFIADGVPAALVTAKGYGAANPVASDLTSIGRFANRRVEFATRG
ncbi:OmpA family protein, partial [Burkholderia ubonensis]|uniref:OmpA family protein n=1 Tax=Burkholderia ubonensis TaxID=101571 RepID=UPI000AFED97C